MINPETEPMKLYGNPEIPQRVFPKSECQQSPVYLFQIRRFKYLGMPDGLGHDGESYIAEDIEELKTWQPKVAALFDGLDPEEGEYPCDDDMRKVLLESESLNGDQFIFEYWETHRVFFTREAAQQFGDDHSYRYTGGYRTFGVSATGELAELVDRQTTYYDGKPYWKGDK